MRDVRDLPGHRGGNLEAVTRSAIRYWRYGLANHDRLEQDGLAVRFGWTSYKTPAVAVGSAADEERTSPTDYAASRLVRDAYHINHNYTAGFIARTLGLGGSQLTISTGCCSGAAATIAAADAIRSGQCDRAVAIGADQGVGREMIAPFLVAGRLRGLRHEAGDGPLDEAYERASNPFPKDSLEAGWVLGAGAAALVLTSDRLEGVGPRVMLARAQVRNKRSSLSDTPTHAEILAAAIGAAPWAEGLVLGFALGDPPSGNRPGLDEYEFRNVAAAIRSHPKPRVHIASLKSLVGHSLGGSSAMALAFAHHVLARRWALLGEATGPAFRLGLSREPPADGPRTDDLGLMLLEDGRSLDDVRWVIANGSGLGGTLTALLLVRDEDTSEAAAP